MPPKKPSLEGIVHPLLMDEMLKLTGYWDKKYPSKSPIVTKQNPKFIKSGKIKHAPKPKEPSWWDLIP